MKVFRPGSEFIAGRPPQPPSATQVQDDLWEQREKWMPRGALEQKLEWLQDEALILGVSLYSAGQDRYVVSALTYVELFQVAPQGQGQDARAQPQDQPVGLPEA